jgi:hypothetical protein
MPVNYTPSAPVAGAARNVSPTEVERWTDYADTIGDVKAARDAETAARIAADVQFGHTLLGTVPGSTAPVRPLWDDFTAPNGTAIGGRVAPSGHVWSWTGDAAPLIQDNAFSSSGTSYLYTDVGEPVARMEVVALHGRGAFLVNRTDKAVL